MDFDYDVIPLEDYFQYLIMTGYWSESSRIGTDYDLGEIIKVGSRFDDRIVSFELEETIMHPDSDYIVAWVYQPLDRNNSNILTVWNR